MSDPLPFDGTPSALMTAALAQLTEGVVLVDAAGRVTFMNDAAAALHGVAHLGVEPSRYTEAFGLRTMDGAPFPPEELPLARAVLRGETVLDARWRIRRRDGSEVLAVGNARPLLAPDGRPVGAVLTLRDDTARHASSADLERANAELRATAVALAERSAEASAARAEAEAARARTANILETMADAHFVLDGEFRFVSANAAMERAVTVTRDRLLGCSIWELFPGTIGTIFEDSYRRVVSERVEVHFTGEYNDDVLALMPEVDAYPTAEGGIAVFWRDVAPRRRAFAEAEAARAEAEAAEARLRDVFEQAPVAVAVLTGPDHVYSVVSPLYAQSPGAGRPLLGRTMREAFPELAGTGYVETMDRVYETGEPFFARERPVRLVRAGAGGDGGAVEEHWFNVGYQPLRDSTGKVYAVASVTYDITREVAARREAEEARREAERERAAAEAANSAKSQFLSTMSHELRTPLNAIAGYIDLLTMELRGPVTDAQRIDLERIRRANQHLMGLVTDVLNFTRLDAGQVEYHVERVEIATVIGDLESMMGPQMASKGIRFDHDGCAADTPDRPHVVCADPEKLRQVLLNLLGNAVKFTDSGGRVSLACETDRSRGMIRLRVSDTGRGIAPEQIERIFEPFVQVDRHRTHESQQGVGLGLAISRDLTRGMGGDLRAESRPGEGSTFILELPVA